MALAAGGCSGELSTLDPAGPSAQAIATLWWIMLSGGAVIFAATSAALAIAWLRPGLFGKSPVRLLLMWGGLILPSIVITTLVLSAFALGERLIGPNSSGKPLQIEAEARQWYWIFRYPAASNLETIDTLHIPAGRKIEFIVTSADVIHSFWAPRLGGKIDAIPGHRTRIQLVADKPGRYGGVCAEYCGEGHGPMRFTVHAYTAEDYESVLARVAAGESP